MESANLKLGARTPRWISLVSQRILVQLGAFPGPIDWSLLDHLHRPESHPWWRSAYRQTSFFRTGNNTHTSYSFLVDSFSVDSFLVYGFLVDSFLVDSILVDSTLVDSILVDSCLVDCILIDSLLVDSILVDSILVTHTHTYTNTNTQNQYTHTPKLRCTTCPPPTIWKTIGRVLVRGWTPV